jgi:HPt (histidine-containing phosphotransfer) domain-containing protein
MAQNSLDTLPIIDQKMLDDLKLMMGSELQMLFIQNFLDGVPAQIEELHRAAQECDDKKVRQKSHRLKGESLQMGANALAAICQQLEYIAKENQSTEYIILLKRLETEFQNVKILLLQENGHEN